MGVAPPGDGCIQDAVHRDLYCLSADGCFHRHTFSVTTIEDDCGVKPLPGRPAQRPALDGPCWTWWSQSAEALAWTRRKR